MDRFADILFVLLGWLLGTLTPGIIEAIKRPKHKAEVLSAVKSELRELRYKVAIVVHRMRVATGTLNQQALDLIRPVILTHEGPEEDHQLAEGFRKLLALGDAKYIALHNAGESGTSSPYPVPYAAPYLHSHLGEVAIFGQSTQEALLRVDAELHLFNEQVSYVRACHDRTFQTMSHENFQANQGNLDTAHVKLAARAETLVWALTRAMDCAG